MIVGLWLMLGVCSLSVHETLLVPVLMYGSGTMIWKEEERSRIRVVQMDKISFLGIRRMDRVLNTQIRELCGMGKGWMKGLRKMFSIDRIVKRLYIGEFAGSSSASQPQKEEVD